MEHKDYIEGYEGSLEDLANAVKDLKYSSLGDFLGYLENGIRKDADADSDRERPQLARRLYRTSESLGEAQHFINMAENTCKLYVSEHKKNIDNYRGSLENLANKIKDLKYDSLRNFLGYLANGIEKDVEENNNQEKYQLARRLNNTVGHLKEAKHFIDRAWAICKPKME